MSVTRLRQSPPEDRYDEETDKTYAKTQHSSFVNRMISNFEDSNQGLLSLFLPTKDLDYVAICEDIFRTPIMNWQDTVLKSSAQLLASKNSTSTASTSSDCSNSSRPLKEGSCPSTRPMGAIYVRLAQTSSAVHVICRSIAPAIEVSSSLVPEIKGSVSDSAPTTSISCSDRILQPNAVSVHNDSSSIFCPTPGRILAHRHSLAQERGIENWSKNRFQTPQPVAKGTAGSYPNRSSLDLLSRSSPLSSAPSAEETSNNIYRTSSRLIVC